MVKSSKKLMNIATDVDGLNGISEIDSENIYNIVNCLWENL